MVAERRGAVQDLMELSALSLVRKVVQLVEMPVGMPVTAEAVVVCALVEVVVAAITATTAKAMERGEKASISRACGVVWLSLRLMRRG